MVWFLVDDNLAFHKKVTSAGNAAMGCWVRAGAWATHNGTDGFIPDHMARQIGTMSQWTSLVTSGLAERQIGGYLYHDWFDVQPSKACVDQRRKRERERKAEQRKRKNVPGGVPADVPGGVPADVPTPSPPTPPPPPARGGGVNSPPRGAERRDERRKRSRRIDAAIQPIPRNCQLRLMRRRWPKTQRNGLRPHRQ